MDRPRADDYSNHRGGPLHGKKLTPAQLQIHDVTLEGQRLDIDEVSASSLVSDALIKSDTWDKLRDDVSFLDTPDLQQNVTGPERKQLERLEDGYGWMKLLRLDSSDTTKKVRWIHVSSTFPEYILGAFSGLVDWTQNSKASLNALRRIGRSVRSNERSSNHGKFFAPFLRSLGLGTDANQADPDCPFLMSMPFLDWTTHPGPPPPLRFQIDEREFYDALRKSRHPIRSLLQYHYRLEDTTDRERAQVYSRHRPWLSDRELDLKVRRIYGKHPTGLVVDELWILVIDLKHIVTFSNNQSWKSRWPAMQLAARIANLSFLGLQRARHDPDHSTTYSAHLHAIVCLHGAFGLVHRSFSEGFLLPCTERYAQFMGHLQYRLYRSPSTKLVMDLLQLQDELAIILNISRAQERLLGELEDMLYGRLARSDARRPRSIAERDASAASRTSALSLNANTPLGNVLGRLRNELDDLTELRTNTNELVNRTVQLVNIRLEDHGQAILVFTLVTVIFLPLSFLCSFFGMNTADIRNMTGGQWIFWLCAALLTAIVVTLSSILAFYGTDIMERFLIWRDSSTMKLSLRKRLAKPAPRPDATDRVRREGFTILDVSQTESAFGAGSW